MPSQFRSIFPVIKQYKFNYNSSSRRVVMAAVTTGYGSKGIEFEFYKSTISIRQEGHPKFKVYDAPVESMV